MGADQLAVVAGEAVTAVGADLAMMIDWLLGRAVGTRMWIFRQEIGVEDAGTLRQHAGQISIRKGFLTCGIAAGASCINT